jgi:hypothetical protein
MAVAQLHEFSPYTLVNLMDNIQFNHDRYYFPQGIERRPNPHENYPQRRSQGKLAELAATRGG